jgi:hypothetical protein
MATNTNADDDVSTYDDRTDKRAQWESYAFEIAGEGRVTVRNHSHNDPSEHEYTVSVENGSVSGCTCPAAEYYDGQCKHQKSVANEPAVMAAATPEVDVSDDGDADDEDADHPPAPRHMAEETTPVVRPTDDPSVMRGTPTHTADGRLRDFENFRNR